MVALCAVDPMECIFDVRMRVVTRHKRDVPPEAVAPPSRSDTSGTRSDHVLIISVAAAGAVLLIMATLFLMFMKRRRASQHIGQDQEYIPTLMDEKSTEEYFRRPSVVSASAPTLAAPSKVHQRTVSVPAMFAGSESNQSNKNDTVDNTDQFHQIPLVEPESEDKTIKRSLSKGFARLRSSTVSAPITALHRSISLNSHAPYAFISRSTPIAEEVTDALPTATRLRFPDAENSRKPLGSKEYSNPSRFSLDMSYVPHRRSTSSAVESSNPSSLAALTAMIESKKPIVETSPAASSDESDDDVSDSTASSDEGFDHIPPHQRYQNFESHSPYLGSDEDYNQQEMTHNPLPSAIQNRPPPQGIAFQTTTPPQPSRVLPQRVQEQDSDLASKMVDAEPQQHTS